MSGAPEFDRQRRFAGWRGFGLFDDRARRRPRRVRRGLRDRGAGRIAARRAGNGRAAAPPPPPIVAPPTAPAGRAQRRNRLVAPRCLRQRRADPAAVAIRLARRRRPRRGGDDNVELSSHERDAFREIARALGARLPTRGEGASRDLIDLAPSSAVSSGRLRRRRRQRRRRCSTICRSARWCCAAASRSTSIAPCSSLPAIATSPSSAPPEGLKRDVPRPRPADARRIGDGGATPMVAAGGELIGVDARAEAIVWDGAPATLLSLRRSREIEYQERLRALERETRDLKALLDSAADGVVTFDEAGRILAMSRGAEALFGYDAREVAGESFLVLFAPQSQSEAAARLERARREEPPTPSGEELCRPRPPRPDADAVDDAGALRRRRRAGPLLRCGARSWAVEGGRAGAGDGARRPPNRPTRARPNSSPASATRCARRCTPFSASPK